MRDPRAITELFEALRAQLQQAMGGETPGQVQVGEDEDGDGRPDDGGNRDDNGGRGR